jgi:hypothetical protein
MCFGERTIGRSSNHLNNRRAYVLVSSIESPDSFPNDLEPIALRITMYADFALKNCGNCVDKTVELEGYLCHNSPNQAGSVDGSGRVTIGGSLRKDGWKKCHFKCLMFSSQSHSFW